ncbi:hypothetical protein ACJX0J_021419, partial [Zea mays]
AKDPSNLLAHGAAFALGQMQDAEAIPDLVAVLKDFSLHPSEALGAIGMEKSIPLLEECRHLSSPTTGADSSRVVMLAAISLRTSLFSLSRQVAYVLGQLQNKTASDAHSTVVKNVCEHPMARHEAAEALGSMRSIVLLEDLQKGRKRANVFWF